MKTETIEQPLIKRGATVEYNGTLYATATAQRVVYGIEVVYLIGVPYPVPVNEIKVVIQ